MLQSKTITTFGSPTLGPLGLPLEKRKKENLKKKKCVGGLVLNMDWDQIKKLATACTSMKIKIYRNDKAFVCYLFDVSICRYIITFIPMRAYTSLWYTLTFMHVNVFKVNETFPVHYIFLLVLIFNEHKYIFLE